MADLLFETLLNLMKRSWADTSTLRPQMLMFLILFNLVFVITGRKSITRAVAH